MRRVHAISPGFSGHYQDLENQAKKGSFCVVVLRLAWCAWTKLIDWLQQYIARKDSQPPVWLFAEKSVRYKTLKL